MPDDRNGVPPGPPSPFGRARGTNGVHRDVHADLPTRSLSVDVADGPTDLVAVQADDELVNALGYVWPVEVIALLLPTGMVSVWTGAVDDGWNGTLGWFWVACAVTTLVLTGVTRAALKERSYSAVMAATGLLYLAILTAFGTDLVARAVLAA